MFSRLTAWIRERMHPRDSVGSIAVTDDGLTVHYPDGRDSAIQWQAVQRVVAFKRDLYASDEIVLVLELAPPASGLLEISEQWPGFADLFGAMEQALGVSPEWYIEIMLPVFEATPRVLYERPGLSSETGASPG